MKNYLFDGQKLMYHPGRVSEFLKRGDCFPLYMEISPVGRCNHRCVFCAYDFLGHPDRMLDTKRLITFIDEIAKAGVKSVLFAGEGEPLLHPDIDRLVIRAKEKGIDSGIYTNGHLLGGDLSKRILPYLTFIRFSVNGGTRENYARVHNVKPAVFDLVVANIRCAAGLKKKGLDLDIGVQYVLLPENKDHLIPAIETLKKAGIDYFVIKPFVQQSFRQSYKMRHQFAVDEIRGILEHAERYSDKRFKVIARKESFEHYGKRNYSHCYGTAFVSVLNSAGDIASCLPYWDKKDYVFGNIYRDSFEKIWNGRRRMRIKRRLEQEIDARRCPPNCRPHAVNELLCELKNPTVRHLNFV